MKVEFSIIHQKDMGEKTMFYCLDPDSEVVAIKIDNSLLKKFYDESKKLISLSYLEIKRIRKPDFGFVSQVGIYAPKN